MGILRMIPSDLLGWFLYIVAGIIVAYSWICCGKDHEENLIE